jgi:hypothetical protein
MVAILKPASRTSLCYSSSFSYPAPVQSNNLCLPQKYFLVPTQRFIQCVLGFFHGIKAAGALGQTLIYM